MSREKLEGKINEELEELGESAAMVRSLIGDHPHSVSSLDLKSLLSCYKQLIKIHALREFYKEEYGDPPGDKKKLGEGVRKIEDTLDMVFEPYDRD